MTDCERCAVSKPDPVPYLTHEKDMERMERMNFHQFIVIIVLIVALVASNLGWVIYENQFVDERIAEKYDLSVSQIKRIVHRGEDAVFFGN